MIDQHVSRILVKRYLAFIEEIKKSSKATLKQLLDVVKTDVRLTTGHNLRSIMLLAAKNTIEELDAGTIDTDEWKISLLQEIIEIRSGGLEVPGMEIDELEEILEYICTG
jgi:hypothetical protein